MKIGRLARWYRWIEYAAFGRVLERRRFAFLPHIASARHMLILGEGDGRTLERFAHDRLPWPVSTSSNLAPK